MVGKYGWEVALRTLKDRDGAALGLPEPVILPITYLKTERSYNSNYDLSNSGVKYVKQEYGAGRGQVFPVVADAQVEEGGDTKQKLSFLSINRFPVHNTSFNTFISFQNRLSELVQAVVKQFGYQSSVNDTRLIQGLLDLEFVYDLIPPEILQPEPIPDWYINFLNSDREPAIQPDEFVEPPLSHEGETWEEYCARNNLVEEEPMSDNDSIAQ